MTGDEILNPPDEGRKIFRNPWPATIAGVAAGVLAVFSLSLPEPYSQSVRLILAIAAALAAGTGVAIQPPNPRVLICACVAALLGSVAIAPPQDSFAWDSLCVLLRVLAVIAGVAAVLVVCPRWVRRLAVSLIILFHFAGILTAVTSTPPQPWVSGQLWNLVFRPYLQFMYLNNAYHFYSPEPGPASLLWFCIEYESDQPGVRYLRWIKEPVLDDDAPWRPRVQNTRRLSLTESTNQPAFFLPAIYVQQLAERRVAEGERIGVLTHPDLAFQDQYREPNNFSKYWLKAYARHVAKNYPYPDRPELRVKNIKIYRVTHRILGASEIAEHQDMYDPTNYLPYYQGSFDTNGKLMPVEQHRFFVGLDGKRHFEPWLKPDGDPVMGPDPLLYWLIPIAYYPKQSPKPEIPSPFQVQVPYGEKREDGNYELRNYLRRHVGDMETPDEPFRKKREKP